MKEKFRIGGMVMALVAPIVLGGCGSGPPPPTYKDAFTNLYRGTATASVPADAPVTITQPVGIIFSDNVEAYFGWVNAQNEYWGKIVPASLTNTAELADNNPNYVSGRFLAMLKQHFPNSEVVHDFQQAVASGKKSVCLLDIQPTIGAGSFHTTMIDATIYFFDTRMNPVSKMSGHGEANIPYPATTTRVQESTDAALQQLDAKLTTLAH